MAKTRSKTPKPPRVHRERVNFYVDLATVKILDNLVKTQPELENRSAAVRFLARWYDRAAQGPDATT